MTLSTAFQFASLAISFVPVTRAHPDVDVGLPAALEALLDLAGRVPLGVQARPVPGLGLAPEALRRAAAPRRPRSPIGAAALCNNSKQLWLHIHRDHLWLKLEDSADSP